MSLSDNLVSVNQRIAAACARSGRDPGEIRLVWVSKNHPRESAQAALGLGARIFGENRVQEALEKFPLDVPPGAPGYELHLIGRLQKNKVRKILPLAAAIHSVDDLELLAAIDRVAGELGLRRDVFLQVNTSREEAKGGFEPRALRDELSRLKPPAHLRIVGLMTMGPNPEGAAGAGPEETRRCFRELAALRRDLSREFASTLPSLEWLSMGMTGDFEIAIEEGAHFLRVGTGLFGHR